MLTQALTVGPVKLEYSVQPGDTVRGEMIVQNEENIERTFYPSSERFIEVNGEKRFSKDENNLSSWFVMQSSITLKPTEQRVIPFTINIPSNADPGGHYAVIWWSTASPQESPGKQVSIVTRAGVLVYVRVAGDIVEDGSVAKFLVNGAHNFFASVPLELSIHFQNSGNVHLKPTGEFVLKNLFGSEKAKLAINPYGLQILPNTSKSLAAEWKAENSNPFGFYKISYDAVFGESEQVAQASRWIFIFSWSPFIWILIVLLAILFIPALIKKYNRWIIGKSGSSGLRE